MAAEAEYTRKPRQGGAFSCTTWMKLRAGSLFGFHPPCGFFEGFVLAAVAVGFGF